MQVHKVLKAKGNRVITIEPQAAVADAIARLVQHNIGSLPVVNAEGRLVGIFTERDVLRGVGNRGEGYCQAVIGDVMTINPVTCGLEDSVHDAMGKMTEHRIGQLPVLDGEEVVGVVSVGDVVKILYEDTEYENRHLRDYIYGQV